MKKSLLLKISLLLITLLFIYSLINKAADVDDAWLGELAYWEAKLGYVKSELMRGITMQHIRHLSHHKFLTLQGALFINLFGFSLYTLKALSLVYFILFLIVFYFYTYQKIFSPTIFLFVLLLFLTNSIVFDYAFIFRPEMPIMTLGFLSYISLTKALESNKQPYLFIALSGLFAGLCFSTHLNGVIFPVAGFLLLLWNRKWQQSLAFGIFTLPTIAIYFYDFTPEFNLSFWLYQMKESPAYEAGTPGKSVLLKLLNEHKRFFHSLQEASLSIPFIVTFALAYKYLKSYKNLIRYTAILVISLAVFAVHKTSTQYLLLYLPYMFILMGLAIKFIYDKNLWDQYSFKRVSYLRTILGINIVFLLYFGANIYYDILTTQKKQETNENQALADAYIKENTASLNVIAPMTFMFNEIEDFNRIHSVMSYTEMQKTDSTIFRHGFLQKAHKYDIDYIFLQDDQIDEFGLNNFTKKDFAKDSFEVLENNQELLVLKSLEN